MTKLSCRGREGKGLSAEWEEMDCHDFAEVAAYIMQHPAILIWTVLPLSILEKYIEMYRPELEVQCCVLSFQKDSWQKKN